MRSERPEPPKLAIPSYRVMFEYTQCENTAKHNYRLFYVGKTLQLLGYINVDKDVRQVARASGRLLGTCTVNMTFSLYHLTTITPQAGQP